jgi:SH3-like domain-containing protein
MRDMIRVFAALLVFVGIFGTVFVGPVAAQSPRENLPIPRFVSLRSEEVNLRTGPGVRYPVEWVFVRRQMPVEILQEFETWRRIRDRDGTEGWVHQSMLTGRRAAVVDGEMRNLRRRPEADAPIVARVEPGVIAAILECRDAWCRLETAGFRGWVQRTEIWGVYPNEAIK